MTSHSLAPANKTHPSISDISIIEILGADALFTSKLVGGKLTSSRRSRDSTERHSLMVLLVSKGVTVCGCARLVEG